jgi:hypothetical protein
VQYLDDGDAVSSEEDVSKVTRFQEMMAEVLKPKYLQCLAVSKNT